MSQMNRPVLNACNLGEERLGSNPHPLDEATVKIAWLCDNFSYSNYEQAQKIGNEVVRLLQQVTEASSALIVKRRIE